MAVRIYLEIGHEASLRTKKTQEGFTHDWEVFVRGCDGAEIQYYIEKVVFYLHETFPKPKRVVKEPPYSVKESGYAGFNLPIDIYLRNSNEPKKIRFNYDLHLQQSGPPIIKVQKEKYIFNSPPDDFKMKLLKGGALVGSSSSMQDLTDSRSSLDDKNQMINKPKLSGSDFVKKQKIKIGEPCRDFQELFGSPINMSSKIPDQKIPPKDKSLEKSRTKHSPHKESHKDKEKKDRTDDKKREEKKQKEKSKDRERSRDKTVKKDKSPRPKSPSPKKSPVRFSSPVVIKHKESKQHEKRDKTDDRKSKKKSKEHKENKHVEEKDDKARLEKKEEKPKESVSPPPPKLPEKKEKSSKEKSSKEDRYSEKYKHKKKDKEKREKKEEKSHKEKKPEKPPEPPKPNLFRSEPPKKEKIFSIPNNDDESSNSSSSSSGSSAERQPEKKIKPETIKIKEDKNQKLKKEKGYQENAIKCKRKSNSVEAEEPAEKILKDHGINNNSEGEQEAKVAVPVAPEGVEEDYFGLLRDLQHKIMGLKDNSDLQKVVKLIAETGRYEVSAHTFDFDLCLLDRSTVQQLQNFFASET